MQLIDTQEVQGELHVYLSQQGSNQVWVCRPVRMYRYSSASLAVICAIWLEKPMIDYQNKVTLRLSSDC